MKKSYFLLLGLICALIVYFLFKGFDSNIEEMYKQNLIYLLVFPILAFFLKFKTTMFRNRKWVLFFALLFTIGFSSGLGIVTKSFVVSYQISYLGLTLIIFSLPLLILGSLRR